jgi:hypothetical protein
VLLLSIVPSSRCSRHCHCHRQTTNAAIAGCHHCRGHRRRRCRRNRIRCSLRRRPHLAAALTSPPLSAQPSQAIAIATATAVVAAVAVAFTTAITTAIAFASAVTIAAASTDVSTAVVIVVIVIIVIVIVIVIVVVVVVNVIVIAAVVSDLTAAYAAAIALASAVAATTALTAVAVFAFWCPTPCASLFWLLVVFTSPLASSRRRHQPDLLSS